MIGVSMFYHLKQIFLSAQSRPPLIISRSFEISPRQRRGARNVKHLARGRGAACTPHGGPRPSRHAPAVVRDMAEAYGRRRRRLRHCWWHCSVHAHRGRHQGLSAHAVYRRVFSCHNSCAFHIDAATLWLDLTLTFATPSTVGLQGCPSASKTFDPPLALRGRSQPHFQIPQQRP